MITYYPEFEYETYNRVSDPTFSGFRTDYELKENPYSPYNSRVHFTPVWFPDETYRVFTRVWDCWTPAGMLEHTDKDWIEIRGNVFDDWHVAVLDPKD